MEQLIELLQQIQDLAGVAIDALQGAGKDTGDDTKGGDTNPADDAGGAPTAEQPPA